jgi:hypothetical protein
MEGGTSLLDLPREVLDKILQYLSYRTRWFLRCVCREAQALMLGGGYLARVTRSELDTLQPLLSQEQLVDRVAKVVHLTSLELTEHLDLWLLPVHNLQFLEVLRVRPSFGVNWQAMGNLARLRELEVLGGTFENDPAALLTFLRGHPTLRVFRCGYIDEDQLGMAFVYRRGSTKLELADILKGESDAACEFSIAQWCLLQLYVAWKCWCCVVFAT